MEYLFLLVGKAYIVQYNFAAPGLRCHCIRADQFRFFEDACRFAHDRAQFGQIVHITGGDDKGCDEAERQNDQHQQIRSGYPAVQEIRDPEGQQ